MYDLSSATGSAGMFVAGLTFWGGLAYVAAPTVAERLVQNGGEIAACERTLAGKSDDAVRAAVAALPKPAPAPDVGKEFKNTFGQIFRHLPNAGAFMDMYGGQIENYGRQFEGPVKQKFEAAKAEYDEAVARIRRAGELQIASAGSACECRARATINSPEVRSTLAWYVGSVGFISASPIGDWQAAFARPEIVAQCGRLS